tara:strand:- start:330 stop:1250 length:921 start_codon:yes stop_codon:yes gene_type:complete
VKILIICSNLIGDTVLSSGVFNYLFKKYPEAKFTFVIGPTAKPLLNNFERIEKIIIIKKKKYNLHWIEILRKCFFSNWHIVIDFRSSLLSFFLLKKKKYVFKKNENIHHVKQLNNSFGFDCSDLDIPTSLIEEEEAQMKMNKNNRYFVIFPGGNWKPKIWPVEKYNELLKIIALRDKEIKFIFVGSNIEKDLYFEKLSKGISNDQIIDLFGQSLTLTAAYMKKSNFFIGNDSGLMHLASACNILTIGLFGPTNDNVYGPWGEKNLVIRTKENYNDFKKIKIDRDISYMHSITSEQVYKKIISMKIL